MTHTDINREFIIRWYPNTDQHRNKSKLVSAARAEGLVGVDLLYKFIDRIMRSGEVKSINRLRRGIRMDLISR